ncbi:MAG: DUF3016 domain-containing protein [Pseudomonadota bacterium]
MNKLLLKVSLAATLALPAAGAMAGATVTFVHPEQYMDMPFSSIDRDQILREISDHFNKLAARLPAGQDLTIEVLDVDLAGHLWPSAHSGKEIRILKGGADWPRMTLRYTLSEGGKVLASGQDDLSDMNYMYHHNRYFSSESLRYEKNMIDEWFDKRLAVR